MRMCYIHISGVQCSTSNEQSTESLLDIKSNTAKALSASSTVAPTPTTDRLEDTTIGKQTTTTKTSSTVADQAIPSTAMQSDKTAKTDTIKQPTTVASKANPSTDMDSDTTRKTESAITTAKPTVEAADIISTTKLGPVTSEIKDIKTSTLADLRPSTRVLDTDQSTTSPDGNGATSDVPPVTVTVTSSCPPGKEMNTQFNPSTFQCVQLVFALSFL